MMDLPPPTCTISRAEGPIDPTASLFLTRNALCDGAN
jgi:hypothetical protein